MNSVDIVFVFVREMHYRSDEGAPYIFWDQACRRLRRLPGRAHQRHEPARGWPRQTVPTVADAEQACRAKPWPQRLEFRRGSGVHRLYHVQVVLDPRRQRGHRVERHLRKLVTRYDNEWGYSNRLVELAVYMESRDDDAIFLYRIASP